MPPQDDLGEISARFVLDTTELAGDIKKAKSEMDTGLEEMRTSVAGKVTAIGQEFQNVGKKLAPVSLAAGGVFAGGVAAAANFEKGLAEIGARADLTAAELAAVKDEVLATATATVFDPTQVQAAFLDLTTSGQNVGEALKTLPSVLNLAAAGGLELGDSADIVTDSMAQFNLGIEQSAFIADALNAGASSSSASVSELAAGLRTGGTVAAEFGLGFDSTVAILAQFAEVGIKGSKAGTGLQSMLTNMNRDTPRVAEAWATLNTGMFDAEGNLRDLNTVMQEVGASMEQMTDEQRTSTLMDLFGAEGMLGANALLASNGYSAMAATMDEAASAEEVAAARMDTLGEKFNSLKGSVETLMIEAFTPLLEDHLKPLADQFIGIVNNIGDWVKENPELTNIIVLFTGAVALLAPALLALGAALTVLAPLGAVLAGPVAGLLAVLVGAGVAGHLAITENLFGLGDALEQLKADLAPVTELFDNFFAEIGQAFSKHINVETELSGDPEAMFGSMGGDMAAAAEGAGGLQGLLAGLLNVDAGALLADLGGIVATFAGDLAAEALRLIQAVDWLQMLRNVGGGIGNVLNSLLNSLLDLLFGPAGSADPEAMFGSMGGDMGAGASSLVSGILDGIVAAIQGFNADDFLRGVVNALGGLFSGLGAFWGSMGDALTPFTERFAALLQSAITNAIESLRIQAEGIILGLLQGVLQPIYDFALSQRGSFIGPVAHAAEGIIEALGPLLNAEERAEGGPVRAGQPYLVGERGPELFVPFQSGAIDPSPAGNNIVLNVYPQINPAAGPVDEQADSLSAAIIDRLNRLP